MIDPALQAYAHGLPIFLLHGGGALLIWMSGLALYVVITPYDELKLIRANNSAAGLSLGAAILGIGIPIAATLASSHSLLDLVVWGATALIIQLVAFRLVDLTLKDLSLRIERGEIAAAAVLAAVKLGTAFMTAAALMG
jgi:putative membrane protein